MATGLPLVGGAVKAAPNRRPGKFPQNQEVTAPALNPDVRKEVAALKGTKLGGAVLIEIMSFWLSDCSGPMP
jgi:hypothetical protein